MARKIKIQPSLEEVENIISSLKAHPKAPNIVPICTTIPADTLTPILAYLKISAKADTKFSFLFESAATTETIGRYSFVGASPRKILKTGSGHGPEIDPLPLLENELSQYREAIVPGLNLPPLTGGAIGYVGYDCVRYFEPKTARPMKDVLEVPESFFMLFDTIISFDHFFNTVRVITYLGVPPESDTSLLSKRYNAASNILRSTTATLQAENIPLPPQPSIKKNNEYKSNIGQDGYESHVHTLKKHIGAGDIIQAVPSQRFSRPTSLHPFNVYRHLRTVNPSPYLFYIDCEAFHLVGASPELLAKSEKGRIITHPIAGTVKRGHDAEADEALATELRNSLKDRAEHVMLVDLARNDVNRVCDPTTTRVDRLMVVEKFSHVQHLVSQVSGVLREGLTRFDAFRSIFPAGTVSGAPKVRAMELIAELEKEKRGVYAGAVGYFGYGSVGRKGEEYFEAEGAMDTCIALRTMLLKDGVAYLQAGGGIVFDSDPYDEWVETMNKLGANMKCIESAEERYADEDEDGVEGAVKEGQSALDSVTNSHVDLAAA